MKPKISNRKYYRQLDEFKKERNGYIHIIIISLSIILIQGSFIYMYLGCFCPSPRKGGIRKNRIFF
ncbi:hypothetical protein P9018_25895, partial [Bacillus cereus]|nr:hypothetical protein [Bacillus cereus]